MRTIYIDGYFFNQEKLGGISRMWAEMIKNILLLTDDVRFIISIEENAKNYFIDELKNMANERLVFRNEKTNSNKYWKVITAFSPVISWRNRRLLSKLDEKIRLFHSSYMSGIYPKLKGITTLITVHDLILHKFKQLFLGSIKKDIHYYRMLLSENYAIKHADHLIAVSQSSKNDLIEYFGFREDMISIIHHGISEHWFSCSDKVVNNSEPYFLFVGSRNPYKNYDTVLKALAKLDGKYKDIKLITVGENYYSLEKEQQRYKELNLSNRVKDLGIVSDMKLKELYSNAIALISPSIYEGFGFPLMESLACGCPVLASEIPTNRELGKNFVKFFKTTDYECLTDKMIEVYENQPGEFERKQYIKYARSYTWESAARKLLKLYDTFV